MKNNLECGLYNLCQGVLTMNEVKWSTALRDKGKQTVLCECGEGVR